jgi:hypothetical protein
MGSCWGPEGVLGGLLGPFFASLGPSGDPWVPPWGCPGPSWQHFPQFRCPKSRPRRIFHGFFNDFQEQILNFQYENSRFHTYLPIPYHNYFLSFQALQSLFPSLLQPSKHPILQWGLAECAERSAAPRVGVLDSRSEGTCQFFFVSSSSCLHLQVFMPSTYCFNHSLQFFALFLALLEGFFSPP